MSKCCICRAPYERRYLSQKTCGDPICRAEQKRQDERKKAERAELKARKEKLKSHSDYEKELDDAFSAYIRFRDKDKPCICCGFSLMASTDGVGGHYDAGHYIPRKHMATRWDEANVNAQRKYCNRRKGGNYVGYRIGLIERAGIDEVLRLEAARNTIVKHTIPELIEKRDYYRAKLRQLKQEIAA